MAFTGKGQKDRKKREKNALLFFLGLASMAKHGSAVTHPGAFLKMDGEVYYQPIIPAAAFRQSVDMRKYWKMMQCVFTVIGFGGGIQ